MRILVTIPVLNAVDTIDATLQSIVTQAGDFHLRCHIRDCGSTDGTAARLARWQDQLSARALPVLTRHLDWAPSPGAGRGRALCDGIAALAGGDDDFLTWLYPGDILLPGALARAATLGRAFGRYELGWFGGTPAVLPTAALAAGLCDGLHWDRLAQPGVFVRRAWWQAIDPATTVAPLGDAADWQIWRLLAQKLAFTQWPEPLGRRAAVSMAAQQAEMAGIAALLPTEARHTALRDMARAAASAAGAPRHRWLGPATDDPDRLAMTEDSATTNLARHAARILGAGTPASAPAAPPTVIRTARDIPDPVAAPVTQEGGILALDAHWQYPAITEQHAFHRMQRLGGLPPGVTYVAYPWATLIDKLQGGARDADSHLRLYRDLCRRLPPKDTAITVCQHIHLQRYLWLFREAGIRHVFWSHATPEDITATRAGQVVLHPFPLYPVQVPRALPDAPAGPRRHLFSFVGARANAYYLTPVRNWIINRLADHPQGVVEGRDGWHYRTVVYDHQIHGRDLPPEPASTGVTPADRFRAMLTESIFSLCPSGTGPNSIRLWESLGAGAIPVILADTWAPPGDPALWQAAAVFCRETEEAVADLPPRLQALAADPARLDAMRRAGRQIWLLYGPDSMVTDIRLLLARLPAAETPDTAPPAPVAVRTPALAGLVLSEVLTDADLLGHAASALLLGRAVASALTVGDHPDRARIAVARATLLPDHPAATLFAHALAMAQDVPAVPVTATPAPLPDSLPAPLAAPMTATGAVPTLCLSGPHANRTPLAYTPFRRDLGTRLRFITDPAEADLVMAGYVADLPGIAQTMAPLPISRRPPIVVLSEEPLWDSIWSGGFETRNRSFRAEGEDWRFTFLNHHTSTIFTFDRLPCFLLTRDDFPVRLALWIDRHREMSPADLCAAWEAAPIPAAFVAERRDDPRYDARFPDADVLGLSVWRSRLAQAVTLPGTLRLGQGWPPPEGAPDDPSPRRQDLPDWHLDKAARLDGTVRLLGAVENTHQNAYVSEKPFDAFALGAVPICHAGPQHRLHDLIAPGAMLNTWDLSPEAAARHVMDFRPDRGMAAAWAETARDLVRRLADTAAVRAERERTLRAILGEVAALV
jgi:hypothetical protein